MTKKFLLSVTGMFFLGLFTTLQAETLTVDQAVTEAIAHNTGIANEALKTSGKERDREMAMNKLFPTLTLGAGVDVLNQPEASKQLVSGKVSSQNPGAYSFSPVYMTPDALNLVGSIQVQLVLGVATFKSIKQTLIDYDNSNISLNLAKIRLARDVRKAFVQLLLFKESIRVNQQQVDAAAERYRTTKTQADTGSASDLTLYQVQVAWQNRIPAVEEAKLAYRQTLFAIEALLGRDPDPLLEIAGSLGTPDASPIPEGQTLSETWIDQRPDVQLAHGQILAARGLKDIQESRVLPNLVLGWNATPTLNAKYFDDSSKVTYLQSGFTAMLSWSADALFPSSSWRQATEASKDQVQSAQLGLEQTRRAARNEIFNIIERLKKSRAVLDVLETAVGAAKKAADLTEKAYDSGTKSLLDVQDAELQSQIAQLQLLNEIYNQQAGYIDLAAACNTTPEVLHGKQ